MSSIASRNVLEFFQIIHRMLSSAFGLIANTTRTAVRHLASKAVPAIGRLNHVAIVVPDLKKSAAVYKDVLGAKVHDPVVCNTCSTIK